MTDALILVLVILVVLCLLDALLYSLVPWEFRSKYSAPWRLLPLSGFVLMYLYKTQRSGS